VTLSFGERTVAAYMIVISERVQSAEALLVGGDVGGVVRLVREIAELALRAVEDNREQLGLRTADRRAILSLVTSQSTPTEQPISECLIDIESSVVRYKAHRPGLRAADAGPKVLNHLLEILSAASACMELEGWVGP
jgi:hypothetical protein